MKKSEFMREYVNIQEWEKSFLELRRVDVSLGSYQMDDVYECDEVEREILNEISDHIHAGYTFDEIRDEVFDYYNASDGSDWYEWNGELHSISICDDYGRYCDEIVAYMDYQERWDPEDDDDDQVVFENKAAELLL